MDKQQIKNNSRYGSHSVSEGEFETGMETSFVNKIAICEYCLQSAK